jgi:methionine synthase II (cobalamin-independent)
LFATLLGGLPRPADVTGAPVTDDDDAVVVALEAQGTAGLEPLTDGRLRDPRFAAALTRLQGIAAGPDGPQVTALPRWTRPLTLDAWRFAATHAAGLVKQALPGPYTLARRLAGTGTSVDGRADVEGLADALAIALRSEVQALADAGCAFVEIEERDAHLIATDPRERGRFASAHRLLLDGIEGVHVSLAILGGNADTAGIETILAAPYPSLAVDLIDGPDNWRLVRATPGDRGIVCGAVSTQPNSDDGPELLIWAAAYAASSNNRGRDRVGLATAGGLEELSWPDAVRKMQRLGNAARLAAGSPAEVAAQLDPRAIDIRSAALGRYDPSAKRPRRGARRP